MKRFLKFLISSLLIVILAFGLFKITKQYNLDIIHDEIDWSIDVKGCKKATGFDMDNNGNMFISFKNSIRMVSTEGKDSLLFEDETYEILDFVCGTNELYIATDNRVISYDIKSEEKKEILKDLPNKGINREIKLLLNKDNLYIAIGSNTNSGIVEGPKDEFDRPSISFTLRGINYGENKTGAFKPFGIISIEDEIVHDDGRIGNAVIMEYNIKNSNISIFSHGIRSVGGFDVNSKDEIFAIINGMEDKGIRPIKDDLDYIYKLSKSAWYGWPDYSGGDPVTSPRFSDGTNKISFILKDHPNRTPSAPYYEHLDVSSLKGFSIDRDGYYFKKNQIIFGDNKQHKIYALDGKIAVPIGTLDKSSYIEKIIINKKGIFILDSGTGCVYKFSQKEFGKVFNLDAVYWVFATVFLITILFVIMYKYRK